MADKRKVRVERKRVVNTYVEMWSTSWAMLKVGSENAEGSYYQFMGSLVFTAFSFEAFLNHVGADIFPDRTWKCIERANVDDKLAAVSEKLGVVVDRGRRPWSILKDLFRYRNDIAHGKSIKNHSKVDIIAMDDLNALAVEFLPTRWEEFVSAENARRAREDVEGMVTELVEKWGKDGEFPFIGGHQLTSSTLLDQPAPSDCSTLSPKPIPEE